MPLSIGITAATFKTSFNALAFKVAAPRRAEQERKITILECHFSSRSALRLRDCSSYNSI
jgi:hypothetical protein